MSAEPEPLPPPRDAAERAERIRSLRQALGSSLSPMHFNDTPSPIVQALRTGGWPSGEKIMAASRRGLKPGVIDRVKALDEPQLSAEQQRVMDAVGGGQNILITGSAGTGKSTLLKAMIRKFGARMPVTASTGIAAVGVGGVTIHSWAGLGMGDKPALAIAKNVRDNNSKAFANITGYNRLAIDEISMISAPLFDKMDLVFRFIRKSDKPFGGMQLVLLGDFLQLPAVITREDELSGPRFAFESAAWRSAGIKTALLTHVFRQADAEFASALNSIRVGVISPEAKKMLNSRYRKPDPEPEKEPVVVHTHNADVDAINDARLSQLPGTETEWRAVDDGREGAVKALQKHCLAPTILRLKPGCRVMLLFNLETGAGLANGSLGTVIRVVEGMPEVKFDNGAERIIERNTWEISENGRVVATREQIPLRLAYAITAHKAQGATLDKIRVFLAKCFEDGQAYVALSRCKTLEGLFIESGNKDCIRASKTAVDFYANTEGAL